MPPVCSNYITWAQGTSIHGISHAANARKKYGRYYWIFWSFTAFVGMSYFLTIRFRDYKNQSTIVGFKYNHYNKLPFPRVVICSSNAYDTVQTSYMYQHAATVLAEQLNKLKRTTKGMNKLDLLIPDFLWYRLMMVANYRNATSNSLTEYFLSTKYFTTFVRKLTPVYKSEYSDYLFITYWRAPL